ncbi:hypothetical protein [Lysinibacillus agricola]|uniref:hypothetical protein n=1 Tax=Lysinibacillus agricola TaxID=2590012 RepID=UPI003C24ECF7
MAGKGIQGINISIGGDTTKLSNALKDVDAQSKKTQSELKEVEKASKLDPTSVEMYAQKQELLQQQVTNTSQKLDVLKTAQAQVEQQFKNGDIGAEQYRAFQRELATTEASLKNYEAQMKSTAENYTNLKNANKDLQTFFQATGTSVDDFADVLGTRLTNAIREGTASTDQINQALTKMGKQALGAGADVEKMKDSLKNINESGLQGVKNEFAKIASEADEAGDSVNGFGEKIQGVAAGLVAGGGLAVAIEQALDVSSLNTNIEISMGIKGGEAEAVRESINGVTAAIGDEEAAYEGVRRQMTLNKNASAETNSKIIEGASMVSRAYKEVDFKELIQESHEVGKELGVTQNEALALTNHLLGIGFPPEQLDIISEYGAQLQMAGFSAEEVQAVMASGVQTGTWNIDNLLDGLKEGRIKAAEFAEGWKNSTQDVFDAAGLATAQVDTWGKAIAAGGDKGTAAMVEMAKYLDTVEDKSLRNALGTEFYGTMWEDQGDNIIQTLTNMGDNMQDLDVLQKELNTDVEAMKADPAYRMSEAMNSVKQSLAPVLADMAEVVASIADWVAENPKLTATLVAVVGTIGTLIAAFAAIMPAISGFVGMVGGGSAALGLLGSALAVITGPIGLTVAALAGLGVGIYAVSQELSESSIQVEDWSTKVSEGTAKAVGGFLDLDEQATVALNQLNWSGQTITQDMATKMTEIYSQMGEQVLTAMKEDHAAQLEETSNFYAQNGALTEEREAEIMAKMQEKQTQQETMIQEGTARINEIWATASKEKRSISDEEAAEIEAIQIKQKEAGIKHLSESERDQKVILSNLKNEASKISAEQAAEVVKNSKKERDDVVKEANEKYNEAVRIADMQKDEMGIISQEEYDKIVGEAKKTKNDTIKNAEAMHQNVVKEAQGQAKEHVKEVDWETGEIKSKWQIMKEDTGKWLREMGEDAAKNFKSVYDSGKKWVGEAADWIDEKVKDISGWFSNLKLKIPKPEMPPMPHFKLETSTKSVFGKNITYPSGLNVEWYAKGGIMTNPTMFGMNGMNPMIGGEAGKEAILPLTPKVLAGIGEGIAAQMNTGQQQVVYIQPQPIYLDGELIGEATYDTINQLQYNKSNIAGLSKGVNL